MPLLNSVTTPYAEALLQVVSENDQTEEMVKEVKQLLSLINDSPDLEKTLSSPVLETDTKKKIINIAGTEKLELVTKIDPSLIGGFVASVGSKVIDASLASQIRKLGLLLSK